MELAVFPPYVAEVSSSPRPTLKVDSGKLLNGANGTGFWISIHSIGDIGPPIFRALCPGINDDCQILSKWWVSKLWQEGSAGDHLLRLADCWTLWHSGRPAPANTNHGEADHPSQSGHVGHLQHGKWENCFHEGEFLGKLGDTGVGGG